jgi:hypothetical protein
MPMPACPECGTTLTILVCGSGEHPTLYKCLLCRALFLGIESTTRAPARPSGRGQHNLGQTSSRAAPDATHG